MAAKNAKTTLAILTHHFVPFSLVCPIFHHFVQKNTILSHFHHFAHYFQYIDTFHNIELIYVYSKTRKYHNLVVKGEPYTSFHILHINFFSDLMLWKIDCFHLRPTDM